MVLIFGAAATYLAFPVMILFYIIGYAWKRTLPQRASEIDLDTGRKSWLTVEEMRAVSLISIIPARRAILIIFPLL